VAAALLMLAPLPPYLHYRSARIATEEKIAAIEAEVAPLRERTARIRQLTEELAVAQGTERRLRELHERRDAWVGLMADLQGRLGRVEDAWFDSMKIAPATGPGEVGWRISVTGRLLDRTNPRTAVSRDASMRVRALLADINASPFVSVAGEKFNNAQPGILQFNFTLVPKTARPL
jgi:Tfp pilus assembly protein PilN